MRNSATLRRIAPLGPARVGLVALLVQAAGARAADPEPRTSLDCGVNALFLLLRLEGRPVTLDQLDASLPPRHPDGYSMAELAAASRALGVKLEGVRFIKGDRPPERPAIAFLADGSSGHFAVLRPVGTTGTMVQVIDPPSPPWIGDYDRVIRAQPWTGRVLVVRASRPAWQVLCGILLLAGVLALTFAYGRQRGRLDGRN